MSAGRKALSKNKSWGTPQKYVSAVKNVFGGYIDLDPCSNEYSIVKAKTEFLLPFNDGLLEKWNFKNIYVNPPYGIDKERNTSIKEWFKKTIETRIKYNSNIIMLVPVATNTNHWKQYVFGKANVICFLSDTRLKFLENGQDTGKGAPMACAMLYYGDNPNAFRTIFNNYGYCF